MPPPAPQIAPQDRIPFRQKLPFSLGYGVDYLGLGLTTSILWMPFFNIGLGLNAAVLGGVLMLLRCWDAFTDPVMGNLSDNTRTRWGRRRPYLLVGSVLTAGVYVALWHLPAGWGPTPTLLLLAGVGLLLVTCHTIWAVPYFSFQMELTPSYDERTRMGAWTAIVGKFVYLAGGWVLAVATGSWFADPATGRPDIVAGMRACSWVIAGLIVVLGVLPAFFVRERYFETVVRRSQRIPFWASMRESARCGPLWLLIGISFFLSLGSSVNNALGQYVSIYLVNGGDLAAASILNGWKSTLTMAVGVLGIPLWTWLSERLDKKTIVTIMLGASVAGHCGNLFCLRPNHPYLMLIPGVFEMGALGAVWLFVPSMKADVADHDELATGRRREGSLNAFASWFGKLAVTIGAGLGGFIIHWTGIDVMVAVQDPAVLENLRQLFIALPLVLWSFTLLFIWRYPLDRGVMADIRTRLEAKRGVV